MIQDTKGNSVGKVLMKNKELKVLIYAGMWLAGWIAGTPHATALFLAEENRAGAAIVVAKDAGPPVRHAAEELQLFLNKVTGAQFSLLHEKQGDGTHIFVGPEAAVFGDPSFSTDGLGDEGIIIRTVDDSLILAGGDPRGTLYAVYTFLEQEVGCHWWSATASAIPHRPTLEIPPLDIRHVPSFSYRDTDDIDVSDPDFSVRNKYNGHHARLFHDNSFHNIRNDLRRGGRKYAFIRSDKWCSHGWWTLIEPPIYFKDHPEWFAMIDGKRTDVSPVYHVSNLCLTNGEMRDELVRNAKTALSWNPHATMLSISQPDDGGHPNRCQCTPCSAVEAAGNPSDLTIWFVNQVTKDLVEMFPDLAVTTLAYHYTQAPPKNHRPHDNVAVRLSTIKCSFRVPMSHPRNKMLTKDLEGWSAISNRLRIWDYVDNFTYIVPHPNLRVLGPNLRYYADHNVTGIFNEVVVEPGRPGFGELKLWLLGQLMWNVNQDPEVLIEQFVQGFYGPAAGHILEYLDLIHDAVEKTDDHLGLGSRPDADFLSFSTLNDGWRYLRAAEKSVEGDPILRKRVRLQWIPVLFTFMFEWDALQAEAEKTNRPWPFEGTQHDLHAYIADLAGEHGVRLKGRSSPIAF